MNLFTGLSPRDKGLKLDRVLIILLGGLSATLPCLAQTQPVLITFEGLQDLELVLDYYNGGHGSLGSGPGPNFGISFGSGAQVLTTDDPSRNFEGNPSGKTIGFFLSGGGLVMNVAAGFTGGFSFAYAAANTAGTVVVYDGQNGTGNILATISLPVTGSNCGGSMYAYSCWKSQGVTFTGVAKSVDFGGTANRIGFDDITLGSQTPASVPPPSITTSSIPAGTMGLLYSTTINAQNGTTPYTWKATGLPGSMQMNSGTGVILGTPPVAGTYPVNVTVTDIKNMTATQTFSFVVNPTPPPLMVSPVSLQFSSNFGGDVPGPQNLQITVPSAAEIPYTLTVDDGSGGPAPAWIRANPQSGTTPGSVQVGILPNGLPKGTAVARVRIAGLPPATPVDIPVSYVISAGAPQVTVAPALLRFLSHANTPGTDQQSFRLRNPGGGGALPVSVSVANNSPWITKVSTSASSVQQNSALLVTVAIDTHGLPATIYYDAIHLSTPMGALPDVPVSLFVLSSGTFMTDAPDGVRFITQQGARVSRNQRVEVRNLGDTGTMLNWSVSAVRGADLVTISPPAGVSVPGAPASFGINLSPTAANAAGGKSALLQVNDTAGKNPPQYFIVVADIAAASAAPEPDPSPAGLFFTAAAGTASQVNQQQISVGTNSASPVQFFVSTSTDDGASWLNAAASSASTSQADPAQIVVTLSTGSLTAGFYSGQVNISIGTIVRSVAVKLLLTSSGGSIAPFEEGVLAPRVATCTPTSVVIAQSGLVSNFSIPAGFPAALLTTVLDNCANPLTNASVVASFSNGDPPISLTGDQTGAYSATWQPGVSKAGMTVTLDASSQNLQMAETKIAGSINANASPAPVLATGGVLNNLNPKLGAPLAPGTVSQMYGSNIATAPLSATAVPLPAALAGVEALIGGMNAPLFYISPGQLNVEIPAELTANGTYPTILAAGGQYSVPQNVDLVPVNPGTVAFPDGTLVAQHPDYTLVSSSHPASPGEALTIYLVGMGATNPPVQSGTAAPSSPLSTVPSKILVTVDGQPAPVTFAGLTPGGVGLYQINFAVPASARTGTLAVVITQDGVLANPTNLIVAAH
jgi:uncharacterized protein (TIGR03437 family)